MSSGVGSTMGSGVGSTMGSGVGSGVGVSSTMGSGVGSGVGVGSGLEIPTDGVGANTICGSEEAGGDREIKSFRSRVATSTPFKMAK